MTKQPPHTDVDKEELESILAAVKGILPLEQYSVLEKAIRMLVWLQTVIREKKLSITRLSHLIFGKKTESLKNLKARTGTQANNQNVVAENSLKNQSEEASEQPNNTTACSSENTPDKDGASEPSKKRNHGRRPLTDFNVTKLIYIPHKCLKAGDKCPLCAKGILYEIDPQILLRIHGQPPLTGDAYAAQGLRCSLCQKVFRAIFPKDVASQPKADISARAIVCLSKYQLGTPLYRQETWQKIMRLPISDAEMWEWTESVALVLAPVHKAFYEIAAQGNVIHNDDTTARVLDLMAENSMAEEAMKSSDEAERKAAENHRKGMFTTALLSKVENHQVAIYVTGRKNAGENLEKLLDCRSKDLKQPIQACDGSSQSTVEGYETDVAKCFNHARHNFCELVEVWPNEALTIVEMCNAVFFNDRETKGMAPEERLKFHQQHSCPVMNKLKVYCNGLIDKKLVEPNSSMGKAINYLNNHWNGLTLFLRNGLAPVSNNDCERMLKSKVLIRKNSYFYKSTWGAFVGDVLLSTIKTCALNGVNPYDYLVAVQANSESVKKDPKAWLPWNYTKNVSAPLVNAQHIPVEEIYQSDTGPPISLPRDPQPCFEKDRRNLRERARDFFKRVYPSKWLEKLCSTHP